MEALYELNLNSAANIKLSSLVITLNKWNATIHSPEKHDHDIGPSKIDLARTQEYFNENNIQPLEFDAALATIRKLIEHQILDETFTEEDAKTYPEYNATKFENFKKSIGKYKD